VRGGPLAHFGQYSVCQRLEIPPSVFQICAHIYQLEVWQKVEKLSSLFMLGAIPSKLCAYDIRDPTIGVAVKVGAHMSEDNIWHSWLGFHRRVR